MDPPDFSSEGAVPGRLQDTVNLIRVHIHITSETLKCATQSAGDRHTSRHDTGQHLQSASSALRKIDTLSSQILGQIEYHEKTQKEREDLYNWHFNHLDKIKDCVKKSLEWIEDPGDPSTSLEGVYEPQDVADRVDKRFRALQDCVEHLSNLNTKLRQDFDKASQGAARLKEELHTQTKSIQKTHSENAKLAKDIVDVRSELKEAQEELRQQKESGHSMRKKKDALANTVGTLKADLNRANKHVETQTKKIRELQKESQDHAKANADLKAKNATLKTDIRDQIECKEKAQAAKKKYALSSQDLEAELEAVKATSEARMKNLQDAQHRNRTLATANKDLKDKNKSLQEDLGVQRECVETTKTEQIREAKLVVDLKHRLEGVQEELRVETGKTCAARKEKVDQITQLQASLKAAQTQIEQRELQHAKGAAAFGERLEQESAEHEAQLKQAMTENDDLTNINKDLDVEVKALQVKLEEELLHHQRSSTDYEAKLETIEVKHDGIVSGLNQHISQQRSQIEGTKKEHEDRLRDLAVGHASELSLAQAETANAQKEISKIQNELNEVRERNKDDQRLIDVLNGVITDNKKEREDLAARNTRLTENLQELVKARRPSKPETQDSLRMLLIEEPGPQDLPHAIGPRKALTELLPALEDCENVDSAKFQSANIANPVLSTSRKRGRAEREPDIDGTTAPPKRPCLTIDLTGAEAPTVNDVSDLAHTNPSPAFSLAAPSVISHHTVSSAGHVGSILKELESFVIPQNATKDDVDRLLDVFLATQLPEIEREARIRDVATGMGNLKLQDFSSSIQTLLRVVHSYSDDETKRCLQAPNSLTAGFLEPSEQTSAMEQVITCESNPRQMELDDINDPGTRQKVKILEPIRNMTERGSLETLTAKNGNSVEAVDEHAVRVRRMCEKWGPYCGVPERWRANLRLKDPMRRLQSLYNKVRALGHDPVTYLWKPDGLLTQACEASRNGKLNSETIVNVSRQLREQRHWGQAFNSNQRRSRPDADEQVTDRSTGSPDLRESLDDLEPINSRLAPSESHP